MWADAPQKIQISAVVPHSSLSSLSLSLFSPSLSLSKVPFLSLSLSLFSLSLSLCLFLLSLSLSLSACSFSLALSLSLPACSFSLSLSFALSPSPSPLSFFLLPSEGKLSRLRMWSCCLKALYHLIAPAVAGHFRDLVQAGASNAESNRIVEHYKWCRATGPNGWQGFASAALRAQGTLGDMCINMSFN